MRTRGLITALMLSVAMHWTSAAELNVGVVNLSRLLAEAPQALTAERSLQEEFQPRRQQIITQEQNLLSSAEKLKQDAATMDQASLLAAEQSLRQQRREVARLQERFLEEFNARRNEALAKLQRSLLDEVELFAGQQDYDLIIGEGVLIREPSVDITSQILSALKSRFEKGE